MPKSALNLIRFSIIFSISIFLSILLNISKEYMASVKAEVVAPNISNLIKFPSFDNSGNIKALATDNNGDLIIVDDYSSKIEKFSVNQEKMTTIASYGVSQGFVNQPSDIEKASDGSFYILDYILDSGYYRVQKFSSALQYQRFFLIAPYMISGNDMALDQYGKVTVASNYRVYRFDPDLGSIIHIFATFIGCGFQINNILDIAYDSSDNFYILVKNYDDAIVCKFNYNGTAGSRLITIKGREAGFFDESFAKILVSSDNKIFIGGADRLNISYYDSNGVKIGEIPDTKNQVPLYFDSAGNLYTNYGGLGDFQASIAKYDSNLNFVEHLVSPFAGVVNSIVIDNSGLIYFIQSGRLMSLTTNNFEGFKSKILNLQDRYRHYYGDAQIIGGKIWVSNYNFGVGIFSKDGDFEKQFDPYSKGGYSFSSFGEVYDIEVGKNGEFYITDKYWKVGTTYTYRIQKFTSNESFSSSVEFGFGFSNDKLFSGSDPEVDDYGNLYFIDNAKIKKFSPQGDYLLTIGDSMSYYSIEIYNNFIYATSEFESVLKVFDAETGNEVKSFLVPGKSILGSDAFGNIYAWTLNSNVLTIFGEGKSAISPNVVGKTFELTEGEGGVSYDVFLQSPINSNVTLKLEAEIQKNA